MVYDLMVYECDKCETALGPGLTVCPGCGQIFDDPVPDDARWDESAPAAVSEGIVEPSPPAEAAPPEKAAPLHQRTNPRWARAAAAVLLLLGLGLLGSRHWSSPPASKPVPILTPRPSIDLAAHPHYAANMEALVQKLRATGVGAEWPAFGSNDVLLITPQARAAELPVAWSADMSRRLAQGVYGDFAQTRFESGFPDTDTTACFVLVASASGQVVAVDFMGSLK